MNMNHDSIRVAIVDGVRTPFVKRRTEFSELRALDLGALCVAELLHRTGIDQGAIGQVVYGQALPSVFAPNIAREVALRCGLPPTVDGYSVSRACATGYQAVVSAADAIRLGTIEVAIAGGADSASDVPVLVTDALRDTMEEMRKSDSIRQSMHALAGLHVRDLVPRVPDLTELSTGLTMGQSAEKMARKRGIGRGEQDDYAHGSHMRASAAWEAGHFDDQVMHVHLPPAYERTVTRDNTVRHDSSLDRYAGLASVFDPEHGTITAGNSSPLTDGASAVLLMSEACAERMGMEPLGFIRGHAFAAVDPRDELLIGPVEATPLALERARVRFEALDLIDMHEAFAAQILAVLQAFEQRGVGRVDRSILNVDGGSIALGHPFAATGARQIVQTLHALRRRGGTRALCTACAAGGLAAAIVLQAPS